MPVFGDFSGPYFDAFGLSTDIYRVNLRIQSKSVKMRTRKILRIHIIHAESYCYQDQRHVFRKVNFSSEKKILDGVAEVIAQRCSRIQIVGTITTLPGKHYWWIQM